MLEWRRHPVLKPPSQQEIAAMSPEDLIRLHQVYHEAIRLEEEDPLRYGFILPPWEKTLEFLNDPEIWEVWLLGGNRSSKSRASSYFVLRSMIANPHSTVFCWSQNDESSRLNQQPFFWELMPAEWRRKQRGQVTKIVYSQANGFTDKNFVLPNGSQCIFKTYSQYDNDETVIEGAELGADEPQDGFSFPNIGNWFDEYLRGEDLLKAMRARLWTRNAKNLISFTPIKGYTETLRGILKGITTDEWKEVDPDFDCFKPGDKVPYIQTPRQPGSKIIYFHSNLNPYHNWARQKAELMHEDKETVLIKAYGVPTRSSIGKFPGFMDEYNVLDEEDLPFVKDPDYPVTRYCIIDPAPRKPWFIMWIAVDASGIYYVYREWPDTSYGDWAVWGKGTKDGRPKSKPGPAADPMPGFSGVTDYVNLMRQEEEGETIFERLIDPRMSSTPMVHGTQTTTMIDDLYGCGMDVVPAPGLDEDQGVQKIQNLIAWNPKQPQDALNRTRLIVSRGCGQTIAAIKNYSGEEGYKEAWKDPIDCLRYAGTAELEHFGKGAFVATRTGGY